MSRLTAISNYYARIDANDIGAAMEYFRDDAVYERADRVYDSKPRIKNFFTERLIRGAHAIEELWEVPGGVVAVGVFEGIGEKGDSRHVGFTDIWTFDGADRVMRRPTFLATGDAIVER